MNPAAFAARQKNERHIIEYVVNSGETSRVELANALGLSTATVTNIVTDLLDKNLLYESRQAKSTVGRKTTLLKFNGELFYVLTVEINADNYLSVSITDLDGVT
jgi:predicted ArsR family transcriptional regulator